MKFLEPYLLRLAISLIGSIISSAARRLLNRLGTAGRFRAAEHHTYTMSLECPNPLLPQVSIVLSDSNGDEYYLTLVRKRVSTSLPVVAEALGAVTLTLPESISKLSE
jgi:2-polyprenyl-6-methoxyphenol hydroxylase-like FAD-dependent oxidoreductase